jgi:hypothetical protein
MRTLTAAAVLIVIGLLAAATGSAQKPPGQQAVTLKASANPVTFSQPLALSGSVKGAKAGVAVTLEGHGVSAPAFSQVAATTTDAQGDFSFALRPRANTVFRATAAKTPPVQSAELTVQVRPLVGLRVSDTTPRKGQRVRFRGTIRPPHDGTVISIQRKQADGNFATVARTRLRDAGDTFSRYGRRLRVRSTGTYRTLIEAHADHAEGISRERVLTVGG